MPVIWQTKGIGLGALPPGGLKFALICAGGFAMARTIGAIAAAVIDVIHTSLCSTGASRLRVREAR